MTTTQKQDTYKKYTTPIFRAAWTGQVFTPRVPEVGAEPKYSLTMIWPKTIDETWVRQFGPSVKLEEELKFMKELRDACSAAAIAKWGPDRAKWPTKKVEDGQGGFLTVPAIRSPFRDGSEKDYDGYGPDKLFAAASSKQRPGLVDAQVKPIINPQDFYGGCYARATVTVFAYANKSMGVSLGLRNVQKVRDGELLTGAGSPSDDFDAIQAPAMAGAAAGAGSTPADGGLGI